MFGITGGTDEQEKQRLIRMGLLTPFGGSSDSAQPGPSSETPTTNSQLPTAPNTSMSEFNWLGLPPPSSPSASTGKGKESAKKSKRSLTKGHSLASVESGGTKNRDEDSAQNEPESQDSTFMLGSDEESSSYYTDEELGGDAGGKQKKKRRVRKVSSGSSIEDDDEELMEDGRKRRRRTRAIDDGDEEMYKLRIRFVVCYL